MCGRMVLKHTGAELGTAFDFVVDDPIAVDMPPRYNIAPTQPIATIRLDEGTRRFRLVRWGLVPSWVKDPKAFSLIINARLETVQEKPSFRSAIRHRRCLIPASGYYEWKRGETSSQPYYISSKNPDPMVFAGVWEEWSGPDGNLIETAAILTRSANDNLGNIHHRMPVAVTPDLFEPWLDVRGVEPREALDLIQPAQNPDWHYWAVSNKVNAVRNDGAELIEKVESVDQPGNTTSNENNTLPDAQLRLF